MEVKMTMAEYKRLEFAQKSYDKLADEINHMWKEEWISNDENILLKTLLVIDKKALEEFFLRIASNGYKEYDEIIYK